MTTKTNLHETKVPLDGPAAHVPPRRVLIVDDNENTCKQLQKLLQSNPALQVTFRTDGNQPTERVSSSAV